jgi:hypothetical protein
MHLAVVVMGIVVPAGYISTPDAFTQLLESDSEWGRLSEGWKNDGCPLLPILAGPTIADIDERQQELAATLHKAVIACEITLFAYTRGRTLGLTGAYRDDPRTKVELCLGKISAGRMSRLIFDAETSRWSLHRDHLDRQEMHDATLCFRQADWGAWLGIDPLAAETPPPPATEQSTEPKAEQPKMVRRAAGAKPTKRETVKDYLQKTYPGGVPPAWVKNESIASLHGVHEKTVRRALKEMGQNTDR